MRNILLMIATITKAEDSGLSKARGIGEACNMMYSGSQLWCIAKAVNGTKSFGHCGPCVRAQGINRS